MQTVILAGGMGTRLREETEYKPKPMIEVGGKPIIWHIMKNLSQQGLNDFIVCLGYKGDQIKDFFVNYEARANDITVSLLSKQLKVNYNDSHDEDWHIILANTGLNTMTGGRILKIKKYTEGQRFMCTYGDGLADVEVNKLISFHEEHGKIATLTAVRPNLRFGTLDLNDENTVTKFAEKPKSDSWVNGGFFIFEPEIFDYLEENSILETSPLEKLANEGELKAFKHNGFWQPMDTYRESLELNEIWETGKAPWKNW